MASSFRSLHLILLLLVTFVAAAASTKPNVLLIMADDQDMLLDSLSVMPNATALIRDKGTTFAKHYCTVAWCCPSRVNVFTGRAAHNTNVTALTPPYGGYPKFLKQDLNSNYLPVWLSEAGVNTYYVGKIMNDFTNETRKTRPQGWTHSSFLVDPYTYEYLNSKWTNDSQTELTGYPNIHTTVVTTNKALEYIDDATSSDKPWFVMVAPVAPHQQGGKGNSPDPPPPPGFENSFLDAVSPRVQNFNPNVESGASWVKHLPQLTNSQVAAGDKLQVARMQNIGGLDEMVGKLIASLDAKGVLDNTYILYTSDNGFHIGNHRMLPGKRTGYETDINIPLLLRGPDVAVGIYSNITSSHTDLAPTILQMLGVPQRSDFDGRPIPYTAADMKSENISAEHVNVEFWNNVEDGKDNSVQIQMGEDYNNTYKSLRLRSANDSFYYSVWCDNEHEFYDMNTDYYQMDNYLKNSTSPSVQYFGRPFPQLVSRLDALLMVLKSCKQDSCRNPYGVLFPGGQATTLGMAMNSEYDSFFANQPKISFSACKNGYILADEGPQNVNPYTGTDSKEMCSATYTSSVTVM